MSRPKFCALWDPKSRAARNTRNCQLYTFTYINVNTNSCSWVVLWCNMKFHGLPWMGIVKTEQSIYFHALPQPSIWFYRIMSRNSNISYEFHLRIVGPTRHVIEGPKYSRDRYVINWVVLYF